MFNEVLQNQFWACEPAALQTFLDDVVRKNNPEFLSSLTISDVSQAGKPKIDNGIAVFEIFGTLLKRCSPILTALFGIRGTEDILQAFSEALADSSVRGIFLHFDSPGGAADAFPALSDAIFNARKIKPVLSFIDGCGCSGACWLATAASYVVLSSEITRTGSIGVLGVHFNVVDRAAQMGIKPTVFSSGRFKSIGTEFRELSETDCQYVQATFDQVHAEFLKGISRNLGISVDRLDEDLKQARVYMGSQAVKVHLAHSVMSRDAALLKLRAMAGLPNTTGKPVTGRSGEAKAPEMRFKGADLVAIIKTVNGCETTDELSKLECELVAESQRRCDSAGNHVEKSEAQAFKRQVQTIIDNRRRFLLSVPSFQKDRAQYQIGRAVGKK